MADEVDNQHIADAFKYAAELDAQVRAEQARMHLQLSPAEIAALRGPGPLIKVPPSAAELGTPEMIMELLKRGFCVFKMPESGNPRDVLNELEEPGDAVG